MSRIPTAEEFVKMFGKNDKKDKKEETMKKKEVDDIIKFAKVVEVDGQLKIIFDGEESPSLSFQRSGLYTPVLNDKVIVINGVVITNIVKGSN